MKDYHSKGGIPYEPKPKQFGYLSVEILPYLKYRKWDEVALAYVHSVRPSSIRVTTGEIFLDGQRWRVTVTVDKEDIIQEITQEVEAWLPDKVAHGSALSLALTYGIDSPECQWHNDPNITGYGIGLKKYWKYSNGETIYFPEREKS
jgi:hypothetical protein